VPRMITPERRAWIIGADDDRVGLLWMWAKTAMWVIWNMDPTHSSGKAKVSSMADLFSTASALALAAVKGAGCMTRNQEGVRAEGDGQ